MDKRLEYKFQMAAEKIYSSEWYDNSGERMLSRDEIEQDLMRLAEKEIGSNSQLNVTAKAYDIALQRLENLDWFSTVDEKLMTKEKWDTLFNSKIKYYDPYRRNEWTQFELKLFFQNNISNDEKNIGLIFDEWLDEQLQFGVLVLFDDYLEQCWKNIENFMNPEHREDVHWDLAPCSKEEFLMEYVNRYSDLDEVLDSLFDIDADDLRDGRMKEKELERS